MNARRIHLLAAVLLTLHLARPAPAATLYSSLQDILIPLDFGGVYLDIDTGTTGGAEFTGWDINPFFGGSGIANSPAFQPARVSAGNLDAVLNFPVGTVVNGSLTYSTGFGGSGDPNEHIGAGAGQFQSGTEGYLGFKFTKNDSSGPFYGWMRVVLTGNTSGAMIKDWAYDNAGGAIVTGRVLQSAPSASTQLVTLSPGTGETFSLGSALTDTGGNINSLLKTGAGTTTLIAVNTLTGTATVNAGTLDLGVAGALGDIASVTVNTGGTLLLSGASGNRIKDTAPMTLAGGTFNSGGLSETLGALTLSANSIIDFAANLGANALNFANSASATWTGTLSIHNWTGLPFVGGGPDQLFFGSDANGLNSGQLNQISFYLDAGSTFLGTGGILSSGEVVPVPEPATWFALAALAGCVLWRERHRLRRLGAEVTSFRCGGGKE